MRRFSTLREKASGWPIFASRPPLLPSSSRTTTRSRPLHGWSRAHTCPTLTGEIPGTSLATHGYMNTPTYLMRNIV